MEARRALGNKSCSAASSSLDSNLSRGYIFRNSNELGSFMMETPSDECDERVEGVNLGELSSVLGEVGLRGLRREDEG
jgi:hypothetical protein